MLTEGGEYKYIRAGGSSTLEMSFPEELMRFIRFDDQKREIILDLREVGVAKAVLAATVERRLFRLLSGASGMDLTDRTEPTAVFGSIDSLKDYEEAQPLAGLLVPADEDHGKAKRFDKERLPAQTRVLYEHAVAAGDCRFNFIARTEIGKTTLFWGIADAMAEQNKGNSPMRGEVVALKLRTPDEREKSDPQLAAKALASGMQEVLRLAKELNAKNRDALLVVIFDDLQEWFPDGKFPPQMDEVIAELKSTYNTLDSIGAGCAHENARGYRQAICWAAERRIEGLGAALTDAMHRSREHEIHFTGEDVVHSAREFINLKIIQDYKLKIRAEIEGDKYRAISHDEKAKIVQARIANLEQFLKRVAPAVAKGIGQSQAIKSLYGRPDSLTSYIGAGTIDIFVQEICSSPIIAKRFKQIVEQNEYNSLEGDDIEKLLQFIDQKAAVSLTIRLEGKAAEDARRYGRKEETLPLPASGAAKPAQVPVVSNIPVGIPIDLKSVLREQAASSDARRQSLDDELSTLEQRKTAIESARTQLQSEIEQNTVQRQQLQQDLELYSADELLFLGAPGGILRYVADINQITELESALSGETGYTEVLSNFGNIRAHFDRIIEVFAGGNETARDQIESWLDGIALSLENSQRWSDADVKSRGIKTIIRNLKLLSAAVDKTSLATQYQKFSTDYRIMQELLSSTRSA